MPSEHLKMHGRPKLDGGRMVLAFTGWMDGGEVSTGTVEHLVSQLDTKPLAEIAPEAFYIYNFPATMEVSAMFRPHGKIEDGLVKAFEPPANEFHYDKANRLVLFSGHEPNIQWPQFADCVFDVAQRVGISTIYFVGSVGGVVPHTREPRLFAAVSHERLKADLEPHALRYTDYEGPVSLITFMMTQAEKRGVGMAAVVAEIPAYVQGRNPKSIIAALRKIGAILGLDVQLDELRPVASDWEKRLSEAVQERPDLVKHIQKLEADYDNELFDTQMGDLKDWLEGQGIRVD